MIVLSVYSGQIKYKTKQHNTR